MRAGTRTGSRFRSRPGRGLTIVAVALVAVTAAACRDADDDRGRRERRAEDAGPTTAPSEAPETSATACADPFVSVEQSSDSVSIDTGSFRVEARAAPARLVATDGEGEFFADAPDGGLFVVREGEEVPLASWEPRRVDTCGVVMGARFADGVPGEVRLRSRGPDTLEVELTVEDEAGVTHWGERIASPADELVYGLMERLVDDWLASEAVPQEVGTLDLRGQKVKMWVSPTMSVYAPFFQTSGGYGLLVDGTMPGEYDLAAADPQELRLTFERAPAESGGRFFLFHGRGHAEILDAYTRLVGRPPLAPEAVFTHWLGHDEMPAGEPVDVEGVALNPVLAADLAAYDEADIPAGIYHFDRPWAEGTEGYGALRFDEPRFPDPEGMLDLLHDRGWKAQVWVSEWVLDERAAEAAARGFLAPGSDRVPDLTDPEARRWLAAGFEEFLRGPQGELVDGFFLDRTDEVVPSDLTDVYSDGRTGREVHNAYPVMMQQLAAAVVREARGDDGWVLARAAYTGSSGLGMQWGGDTRSREGVPLPERADTGPPTDLGLRSVLVSLQRAAFLGLPYWGSDIGGYSEFASRDLYARWIEAGALSPLMRFHGKGRHVPWDMPTEPGYDDEMLDIYRRYVVLHHSLSDYLTELADEAHARGTPIARPLVFEFPDDPGSLDRWDEWLLGPDLLVAPVWRTGARSREVHLPPGAWVDFWDRDRVVTGPADLDEDVPLDRIPLFVRAGSSVLEVEAPE